MINSFFKIRENIEDFVIKEIENCEEFSFYITNLLPVNFSPEGFKQSHWLVKAKNKKALEEFKLELENKFSKRKEFSKTVNNQDQSAEFLYLVVR
jgi:hypothetical protein